MVLCAGCSRTTQRIPKMIVLGVDGMDPVFVERHWDALPNLQKLAREGKFTRLATTSPPQSPVAWSTFITGLPPAEHGIYDFVHRDPVTLQPFSSMSHTEEPRFQIPLGPYRIPVSSATVTSLRKGKPFWETLAARGVPVTVIRMPTNYPPAPVGRAIAGMGVPDLAGTLGTFTFFTDDPMEYSRSVAGGRIRKIDLVDGRAILAVDGPPNPLRKDQRVVTTELTVDVDAQNPVLRLASGETMAVLRKGEWSEWIPVKFALIPHLSSIKGMLRVYIKQVHPRLQIYTSAVNADPLDPALPISFPAAWSRAVAQEEGRFYTMGTPEDTAALRQNVLTLDEFREEAGIILDDERQLLRYSLRHFDRGLLFFYFSSIDQNSHVLWGRHESELLKVYRAVDECIGEARRAAPDAELVVMSDHGFARFDRAVHLNTWLRNRGFLSLKELPGARTTLDSADWPATEAYALGLNGLYVNQKGREPQGSVSTERQRAALIAILREQLTEWRDPLNGNRVVEAVDAANAAPQNAAVAPDLIVGYAAGYRASWQTALGGVPEAEIENNDDAWIGDHCINRADVPGVLFLDRGTIQNKPGLADVTAMILRRFGVEGSKTGRNE